MVFFFIEFHVSASAAAPVIFPVVSSSAIIRLANVVLSSRQVYEHSSIVAWCRRILLILCILAVAFVVTPVINAPHRNPQIYQFSNKCRHRRHKLVPSISFEGSITDFLGKRGGAQYFKIFSLPLFVTRLKYDYNLVWTHRPCHWRRGS